MTFRSIPLRRTVAPALLLTLSLTAGLSAFGRPQAPATPIPPVIGPQVAEPSGGTGTTFAEPIVKSAADPWIAYRDGYYYMTHTTGGGVSVRKSPTIAGLSAAKETSIWRGGGPGAENFKYDVWAPEMHYLRGHWYVYFCATDSLEKGTRDRDRRMFCLESKTDDPLGEYTFRGKMTVLNDDAYAIDPTVYERPSDKSLYLLWSGREAATGGAQNIYIAPLSDPWTISGPRVRLSTPEFDWEKHGWKVNEGPEVLERNGKTFITYSASGGTTPFYCLGLLKNTGDKLLDASAWKKSDHPVLTSYSSPFGPLYTVGHNGFFKSPDGKQDWIVFHAKTNTDNTWGGRAAYAEPVSELPSLMLELR